MYREYDDLTIAEWEALIGLMRTRPRLQAHTSEIPSTRTSVFAGNSAILADTYGDRDGKKIYDSYALLSSTRKRHVINIFLKWQSAGGCRPSTLPSARYHHAYTRPTAQEGSRTWRRSEAHARSDRRSICRAFRWRLR